jgi:copper oxidase (laccase) domain-containing protein
MGKKKKENIRITRKDFNKDYTFVSNDNILNNVNNIEDNESATATTTNNEIKFGNKSKEIIEKKKVHSKKVDNKERKILGKSLQGHSPIYE